jgi:hypothetical protein
MTVDQQRQLRIADWHVRESFVRQSIGDSDAADYHVEAAREFLRLAVPGCNPGITPDELVAFCTELMDQTV